MDYSFPELGSDIGAGLVKVVEILVAVRQVFWELLAARVGHLFLKWLADPQ
jgi:hypothetical protein